MNLGLAGAGGANFNQLNSLLAESKKNTAAAKARGAQLKAEQAANEAGVSEQQQAQQKAQQLQAAGGLTMATGSAMMAAASAIMAIAGPAGAGWAIGLLITGGVMVLGGAATQAVAMKQLADATNKGNEELANAVNNGVLAAEEGKVVSYEMQRSNMIEMEKAAVEQMLQELRAQNPGLSDEELANAQNNLKEGAEKGFEDGAKSIRDGGIATVEGENGETRYFTRKENGDLHEVSVKSDENGDPVYGSFGEVQLDEDLGQIDSNDPDALKAVAVFSFADQIKQLVEGGVEVYDDQGNVTDVTDPLSRLRLNDDGTVTQEDYDLDNPVHAAELYALVLAAHQDPPPYKYYERTSTGPDGNEVKELGFEKPDGSFVTLNELTNEETKDGALSSLGFTDGEARYELLETIADASSQGDLAQVAPDYYSNLLKQAQQDALNNAPGSTGSSSSSSLLDGFSSSSGQSGSQRDDNSNGLGSA